MTKTVNRNLTVQQRKIFNYISSFSKENGYSPSLKEIASNFGLEAISTVHQHIKALKTKGYLKKVKNYPRGISLFEKKSDTVEIPLLGIIAAGNPIEPIENPEPIKVPKTMIRKQGNYYALRVQGDSMKDMLISDRDIILIKHQSTAENGDVVVGIVNGKATLKVYKKKGSNLILEPRNPNYQAIKAKEIEIRGKYVGLIKNNNG